MDQPPDDQFLELWEDAKRQYEKDTKITLAWDVLTTCRTPDALLAKLDNQLGRFEAYRSKQKELQKWLNPMVHLIASLCDTAGAVAGVAVAYSKVAFVAFGVMVKAAKNVSESYDGIISLCELQLSFLDRLRVYGMSAHLPIVIQILIHLLSVFALVTKAIKDGRLFTYLKELIGRNDVQKALTKLEDLIKAEKSMGTAETIVFSKDILDRVYGLVSESGKGAIIMAGMNERLEQATQFAEVAHEREMQQLGDIKTSTTDANKLLRNLDQRHVNESIHKWLKFPDPWRNHDDARDLHDDDTGTWLLKSFEYKSWKTTLSSLFWMYGKPGVGKTIICSTVIEDLQATSRAITAFFYFYKRDAEKHSLYGMLSSIIYQLDRQLPDAKSMLLPMHNQFLVWKPRLKNLIGLLEILISRLSARPIFIVLDALDECSEPKELENLLGLLRSTRVHVLVTSRREEVVQMLEPLAASKLDLSSAVKPDISRYLERVFTEDKSFRSWKQADRDHARTYLLDHSDGMFQWVKCQLDELRDCMPQDLEDQLSSLPCGLDATYERTLSRISDRKQLYARHLFNWLAFSFRPLHVKELA
ncbi:P-loop containing nucleoside triphosphate hydrolase protein [Mycena galericulata]|nr:P-loop containing nucleoside triphosphate hydrolase protein [Mycena galericulata]